MPLFHRREPRRTPPEGFGPDDIRTRSSICTGETTVGFYDPHTDKLLQVDGKEEFAVYMAPVGVRDESKNEQNTKKLYANV